MKKEHVLFGISPFNSKFNKVYLEKMLEWGFENYRNVDVLHPHEAARYLLIGCGDESVKANKKSRKEFHRTEQVVNTYLLKSNNLLCAGKILKFSDFYNNVLYKYLSDIIRKSYDDNKVFYQLCMEQSQKAVTQRKRSIGSHKVTLPYEIEMATQYILEEIPFIIAPSLLFSTNNAVHISYYCNWPIAAYLYKGELSILPFTGTRLIIKDHACE